jgi:hypothetical protein
VGVPWRESVIRVENLSRVPTLYLYNVEGEMGFFGEIPDLFGVVAVEQVGPKFEVDGILGAAAGFRG